MENGGVGAGSNDRGVGLEGGTVGGADVEEEAVDGGFGEEVGEVLDNGVMGEGRDGDGVSDYVDLVGGFDGARGGGLRGRARSCHKVHLQG